MAQMKNVVMIPHWVYETLKRKGYKADAVLNFNVLREHVAVADIAGIHALNLLHKPFGLESSIGNTGFDLRYNQWHESATGKNVEFLQNSLTPMLDLPEYRQDVFDRLFSPDSREEAYETPFIIYDLTSTYIGVVIYPGFFTGEEGTDEQQFNLLEALLKAFYVNTPFHLVAVSEVFYQYLGLLSKKRIMV